MLAPISSLAWKKLILKILIFEDPTSSHWMCPMINGLFTQMSMPISVEGTIEGVG